MKNVKYLFLILLFLSGCASVTPINNMPHIVLGEPSFYPTLAAHTDASIIAGNRVDLLFNGDQIFPAMLEAIHSARKSITYAQYLYEDGAIAHEIAEAFAERCRAGVQVKILLDSLGAGNIPQDIPDLWKQSGCQLEWFERIKVFQFVTPWELLNYNHRSHRRILVIDGKIGFTGGHGVSDAWTGDGRTAEHWRQTDVRVEGPIVQQLQAAFVDSWRRTTGDVLGDDSYFPALDLQGKVYAQVVKSSPLGGSFGSYLLFLLSITSAQKSIHIANPYFFPDSRIEEALTMRPPLRPAIAASALSYSEALRSTNIIRLSCTPKPWLWTECGRPWEARTLIIVPSLSMKKSILSYTTRSLLGNSSNPFRKI
jgi:phosphatidylserine/phosphatidylglycerophosphate/cardiolipin synthase-like enzyme